MNLMLSSSKLLCYWRLRLLNGLLIWMLPCLHPPRLSYLFCNKNLLQCRRQVLTMRGWNILHLVRSRGLLSCKYNNDSLPYIEMKIVSIPQGLYWPVTNDKVAEADQPVWGVRCDGLTMAGSMVCAQTDAEIRQIVRTSHCCDCSCRLRWPDRVWQPRLHDMQRFLSNMMWRIPRAS